MLAELIQAQQPCVVLTGAGVSTESGIPDFRSASGIWARYDPQEYATIDAFRRDPVKVWDFYAKRLGVLATAEPNAAHRALARLEEAGLVRAIVTQNVDGLHQAAGSRVVVEMHGSIRSASCLRCRTQLERDELTSMLETTAAPPCPACGAILKPDVVMFGELLPVAAIERATALARGAALLLVVGSSLEVWPVAGLPQETLAAGGAVAIVNRDTTPYDEEAAMVVRASAGETLAAAATALRLPVA
jgi:NAD-dependent deacetylase